MSELAPAAGPDKRVQVEKLLSDIFSLMEYPTRLDFKDAEDGGIAVALHFDGEVPGVTAGKKSYLVDSIQFLVNKVVNRPNTEKRWVSLGVGAFPEPRQQGGQPQPAAPVGANAEKPAASTAAAAPAKKGGHGKQNGGPDAAAKTAPPPPKRSSPRPHGPDELSMEVSADAKLTKLGKLLAEKAAKHGRHYAVLGLTVEDRARLLQAAKPVAGVTVKAEGESYLRRATILSAKPNPMPKKAAMMLPHDDDEE